MSASKRFLTADPLSSAAAGYALQVGQNHAGLSSGQTVLEIESTGIAEFTEQTLTTVDELTNDLALTRGYT